MKALIALLVATSACSLYSGGDNQRDAGCAVAKEPAPEELIDPSTNQCDSFPLGGGGGCECQPCPGEGSPAIIPNWAQCDSACTGLAEQACLTTSGCHATYQTGEATGTTFWTCDAVAPDESGLIYPCSTLEAVSCSTRDDCVGLFGYGVGSDSPPTFASCAAETPQVACATLTDEASCTARTDCEAVYTGVNCTCDEHGSCTCESETFASCEPPPP